MRNDIVVPAAVRARYFGPHVRSAAVRLTSNLEARRAGAVERLRDDPVGELTRWTDELSINTVPAHQVRGGCSVLGQYGSTPPTITLVRTGSTGQRKFTALHELGHHEQNGDISWFDEALSRQSDQGKRLEEQVCDAFAAELLLGDDVVQRTIGAQRPTAEHVLELRDATGASGAACCVRVAQLLDCEGFVLATDIAGQLLFAAVNGGTWYRPKRGTAQGADSLAVRAAGAAGLVRDEDAFLQYGTGTRVIHLRGDAIRSGGIVYSVLRDGRAPWQVADLGPAPEWDRPAQNCDSCGYDLEYPGVDPCPDCRRPTCPECGGRCRCSQPSADRTCSVCRLTWGRSRFPDDGTICADCH